MSHNYLSNKGAKEFAIYFAKNPHIEYLDLSKNKLSRAGLRRIKELVIVNPHIKTIVVKDNKNMKSNAEMCERQKYYDENL